MVTACAPRLTKEQLALRAELRQALGAQQFEKAAELGRRAVEETPHDDEPWDRLAQAYFGLRDYDGVRRALAAWRVNVSRPSPRLEDYAGDLALVENDPAAAVQFWKKARRAWPKDYRLSEKIAQAEEQQRLWNEAEKEWSDLVAAEKSAATYARRALCRRRQRHWSEALADERIARQMAPDDPEVARVTKLFNRISKFLTEMRELDAHIAATPKDAGLLADRALLSLRAEDPELALDDAEEAAALDPKSVRPKLFQAIALIALGRAEECEKLGVEKFIRLATLRADVLETLSRLDAEIAVERNNAELYAQRAWQLDEIAQPRLASQDAERAIELDPKNAGALAEGAYALMKLGRAEEAFERAKRATAADGNYFTGWQYRGELELQHGDFVAAVESFTRALAISQSAVVLQKREECYRHLGLLVNAEQDHRAWTDLNARETR